MGEPSTNGSSIENGPSPRIHEEPQVQATVAPSPHIHEKPQVKATVAGNKHTLNGEGINHIIDIPAQNFERDRIPNKERNQNPSGNVALLFAGVSAQAIQTLVGGPEAVPLPGPIFYCAAATNAIAFVASTLAHLLLKKKPRAAGIF